MLNQPRNATVRSMLVQGILAALLGVAVGCGASSPAGPTSTPLPLPPAPVTVPGVYTVTAGANVVAPGGQLSVSWTTSATGHNDWIALFRKGDPHTAQNWLAGWTDGAASGRFTLSAPGEAGQYEFRYFVDDSLLNTATSSLVTVETLPQ